MTSRNNRDEMKNPTCRRHPEDREIRSAIMLDWLKETSGQRWRSALPVVRCECGAHWIPKLRIDKAPQELARSPAIAGTERTRP